MYTFKFSWLKLECEIFWTLCEEIQCSREDVMMITGKRGIEMIIIESKVEYIEEYTKYNQQRREEVAVNKLIGNRILTPVASLTHICVSTHLCNKYLSHATLYCSRSCRSHGKSRHDADL